MDVVQSFCARETRRNARGVIRWGDSTRMDLSENWNQVSCVYLDPPYLITASEYNKLWNQKDDDELCCVLDELNENKIRFALSDVVNYKDKKNEKLLKWAQDNNYIMHPIKSNYINYHDNSIKTFSEVLITNYGK